MWTMLLSRTGLTAALVAVLFLALGLQSTRLKMAQSRLLTEQAMVVSCRADNTRLNAELRNSIEDINEQNRAIQVLQADAEVLDAKARIAAASALQAARKSRDVRRPSDAASLNVRLQEILG